MDLKQLRVRFKDAHECLLVSPDLFDALVGVFLDNELSKDDTMLILLILSNILLVNRELTTSYFRVNYSKRVLSKLTLYVLEIVPSSTYNQILNKKSLTNKITGKLKSYLKIGKSKLKDSDIDLLYSGEKLSDSTKAEEGYAYPQSKYSAEDTPLQSGTGTTLNATVLESLSRSKSVGLLPLKSASATISSDKVFKVSSADVLSGDGATVPIDKFTDLLVNDGDVSENDIEDIITTRLEKTGSDKRIDIIKTPVRESFPDDSILRSPSTPTEELKRGQSFFQNDVFHSKSGFKSPLQKPGFRQSESDLGKPSSPKTQASILRVSSISSNISSKLSSKSSASRSDMNLSKSKSDKLSNKSIKSSSNLNENNVFGTIHAEDSTGTIVIKGSSPSLNTQDSRGTNDSEGSIPEVSFETLVPVYRLIFLILYDETNELDELVLDSTNTALIKGLNYCFNDSIDPNEISHFDSVSLKKSSSSILIQADINKDEHYNMQSHILPNCHPQDEFHILASIEILKSLYSFSHKHTGYVKLYMQSLPYLMRLAILLNSTQIPINSTQYLLMNNIINAITIILTKTGFIEYYHLPIYKAFSQSLMILINHRLVNFLNGDDTDITSVSSLFVLITYLTKEFIRHSCRSALKIFKKNFIPPDVINIPIIYTNCLKVLTLTTGPLESNPVLRDRASVTKLKNLIIDMFFELSWRPEREAHYIRFLECVGTTNAKVYILNNQPDVLQLSNIDKYNLPLYFYGEATEEKLPNPISLNESFKEILEKHEANPINTDHMTEEEKEAEAEKLYTIFDRMEKTGVFQGFKNPVKEWQEQGRFEDLDDPSKE